MLRAWFGSWNEDEQLGFSNNNPFFSFELEFLKLVGSKIH
jgi:hypothetical protein